METNSKVEAFNQINAGILNISKQIFDIDQKIIEIYEQSIKLSQSLRFINYLNCFIVILS